MNFMTKNLNFYINNDIENYIKECDENESQIGDVEDTEIAVPTEEDVKIQMKQEKSTSLIKFISEKQINPLIKTFFRRKIKWNIKNT